MTQIIIIHSKCFAVSDWIKKVKFCIEITRVWSKFFVPSPCYLCNREEKCDVTLQQNDNDNKTNDDGDGKESGKK